MPADEGQQHPFDSARADLERLAGLLQGAGLAGLGEVKPGDIQGSLESYWQDHEPALRAGATALTEQVRLQTLAELNKWREQLAARRKVLESTPAPGSGSQEARPPATSGDSGLPCVQKPDAEATIAHRIYQDYRLSQDQREAAACDEPDVLLDVPVLRVAEIDLDVDELRAHVAVVAELADLLRLSVGADVNLEAAKLRIKGVEAQALLKVRLEEVRAILDKALSTIGENPEILDIETLEVDRTLPEVGGVGREAVNEAAP